MKVKFIIIYLFIVFFSFLVLYYEFYLSSSNYILNERNKLEVAYKSIYKQQKRESKLIYDLLIKDEKIIDILQKIDLHANFNKEVLILRKELFDLLKDDYKNLKHTNLRQLHFHTKNNLSLLRMHRPNKFADDLTNIRNSVMYVNRVKKFIGTFEEGKIYNGYRFVYPLFFQDKYLGSVEISYNAKVFTSKFFQQYGINSNFYIRKDLVDRKVFENEKKNYKKSFLNSYVYDKEISSFSKKSDYPDEFFEDFILDNKVFTKYNNKTKKLHTFIPVQNLLTNETVAFFEVLSDGKYINKQKSIYLLIFILICFFLAIIIYLVYLDLEKKNTLNKILERKVKDRTKQLEDLNQNLEIKIQNELNKRIELEKRYLQRAKLAHMGQLIGNIAHQWRQPLSVISTAITGLQLKKELSIDDNEDFDNCNKIVLQNVDYLTSVIDSFQDFIKKESSYTDTVLQDVVNKTIKLNETNFKHYFIKTIKKFDEEDIVLNINGLELSQVLLKLFNNSLEVMQKNEIENKEIIIEVLRKKDFALITVEDNAGGIDEKILPNIFEPYFTTKHQSQGVGIGLYMCFVIVHNHFGGQIYVKNSKNGAKFFIELPFETKK